MITWNDVQQLATESLVTRPSVMRVYEAVLQEFDPTAHTELLQYRKRDGTYHSTLDTHFKIGAKELVKRCKDIVTHAERAGPTWRGLPVYRGIGFRRSYTPLSESIHWSNIGSCWAYRIEGTALYQASEVEKHEASRRTVEQEKQLEPWFLAIVAGHVNLNDINWVKTLYNATTCPTEFEVRMLPGAVVTVTTVGVSEVIENPAWDDVRWIIEYNPPKIARVHEECGDTCWKPRT